MNNKVMLTNYQIQNLKNVLGEAYTNVIRQYYKNNDSLNYESIVHFLKESKKTKSNATIALYKAALKKLIKYRIKDLNKKAIIDTAFSEIKVPKPDKTITKEKIVSKSIINKMMKLSNEKNKLIIQTLYATGLRVSELINIKKKDCRKTIEDNIIYMSVSVIGKGNKERKIKLEMDLYKDILNIFEGKIYLFETKNKRAFTRQYIYRIVNTAGLKALGTRQVHPHTLRHSFATELLIKDNKSLKAVSKYLGHSSTAITSDFYIHDELSIRDLLNLKI
ncbi:integrase [Brachyspira hyodysenteriae]|uniref:tyrosine-type recombinase/integrase n=1 Tax=Brachyspira hyodysenteriae TaxID=159 RepID=UPI00063D93AA|nr:tyrosine-type recombinase/integrase [Brachyspira hyodysenteriae]KLI21931.1 integrase [Brachyspira hyodysenteriae]